MSSRTQECITPTVWTCKGTVEVLGGFHLSNSTSEGTQHAEIIFDYKRAEGGVPYIETTSVRSNDGPVDIEVTFSETYEGLHSGTGDGPFFLFSNAMDTYRVHRQSLDPSTSKHLVRFPFAQRSQRYQKVVLLSPNASITISAIGFTLVRPPNRIANSFSCSNEKLNKIWRDGVRTVDMCTVEEGETADAWEVTEEGTRILGQHWAPLRQGTRWKDITVDFEVQIEEGGASWGVHMVANGLIFCLDLKKRSLAAFEGLSDSGGIFPAKSRGIWNIETSGARLDDWNSVRTIASGSSVMVEINGIEIASVHDLDIHPMLGGCSNNSGSVAFGGPQGYIALYRSLKVTDPAGQLLYENDFLLRNKDRTLRDFQVGTNALSCTVDGAKRDRAVFGGDLFVMGRSIYYSTGNLKAALGSIRLLTSHQMENGYLGNLCPIQAPVHEEASEPPTYAFYSLSYALLLVIAIKDYWMHSGDSDTVCSIWTRLEKLISFTENFLDERGLVMAPPPLSMDWFPMGGPIFGASGKINLAFYDALQSMSKMAKLMEVEDKFSPRAACLRESIVSHLWNETLGTMRMSDTTSPDGICQDINAYAVTLGISPSHPKTVSTLAAPTDSTLPLAYQNLERWDKMKVVSPYASGFAAEALFEMNNGVSAVELIERVWGFMADETNPNYSGGHWEAMKVDGSPCHDDTSLMHGWSTFPVYLLPRYLCGLEPLEAGWTRFKIKPILAGLESVSVQLSTPAGNVNADLHFEESQGTGRMVLKIPVGTLADVSAPEGWVIGRVGDNTTHPSTAFQTIAGHEGEVIVNIHQIDLNQKSGEHTSSSSATSQKSHLVNEVHTTDGVEDEHEMARKTVWQRLLLCFS